MRFYFKVVDVIRPTAWSLSPSDTQLLLLHLIKQQHTNFEFLCAYTKVFESS